jgi:hypothetical protein
LHKLVLALSIGLANLILPTAHAAEISADGRRLAAFLDSMDVEHHWPAGVHVHWESGVPDGRPEKTEGKHTHCSAFVAAAAKQLNIYILRPPEHAQVLLANAQYDWLGGEGQQRGWREITHVDLAQQRANRGDLVVATYRNHHDDKPGHIAIVRPSDKSSSSLSEEGPQITQAGGTNYTSAPLNRGFAGHPAAWSRREVRFFAHDIEWQSVRLH